MSELPVSNDIIAYAADIIAAFVSKNAVASIEIPGLIGEVYSALLRVSAERPATAVEAPRPAVSPRRSITSDFLICLEDGRKFKSLKRHLRTCFNMSPDEYRAKWNLPQDYPMVAPNYAKARSDLAKQSGLGQRRRRRP